MALMSGMTQRAICNTVASNLSKPKNELKHLQLTKKRFSYELSGRKLVSAIFFISKTIAQLELIE